MFRTFYVGGNSSAINCY